MMTSLKITIKILAFILALVLFGCAAASKSSVQRNEAGINEAYLGCLMFGPDIQECSDLRWGAEQALYNKIQTPSTVTIKDLKKATPPKAGQE